MSTPPPLPQPPAPEFEHLFPNLVLLFGEGVEPSGGGTD